jgi:hypothetical protein
MTAPRAPRARCALAAGLLAAACGLAVGSPEPPEGGGTDLRLQALRLRSAALQIDGRLDEPLWQQAAVQDSFVQLQPRDRMPAPWRTTVQLVVDDSALVFGIRAYDPRPQEIRAPLVRRDQVLRDQDYVAVFIDPSGRRRHAQFIRVGASGIIADGIHSAQDDEDNYAPDFEVQAAVQRLPDGYSVELRIPLAELRYPYVGGQPWRAMVMRSVPRGDSALWVNVPLTLDALHQLVEMRPIAGIDDLLEHVRDRGFLRLRPEVTLRQRTGRDGDGRDLAQREASLGLALKWRPRADWVVDAMVNPDFSQVELDQPQLSGNVRYALYQAEKRHFFLESVDVTGQGQGGDDGGARGLAAYYSRAFADPSWGLRATWRGAEAEATALSLRDRGGGTILRPDAYGTTQGQTTEASTAAFARGYWHFDQLGVAAVLSLRDFGQRRYNRVFGSKLTGNLGDSVQWQGQALMSATTAQLDSEGALQQQAEERGHYLWLDVRQRSERWASRMHLEEISPRFANDNGFVSQSGIRRLSLEGARRLGSVPLGLLDAHEFELQLSLQDTRALSDPLNGVPAGERVDRQVSPGIWFSGPRMLDAWAHLNLRQGRNEARGTLHGWRSVDLGLAYNPAAWFSLLRLEWEGGQALDVDADRVVRGQTGRVDMKFRTSLPGGWALEWVPRLTWSSLQRPGGGRSFDEWAARSLAVLHFGPSDSLRLIAQRYSSRRLAEADVFERERGGTDERSLIYQHRDGQGTVIALGVTRASARPGLQRQTELFAKYSAAFWR